MIIGFADKATEKVFLEQKPPELPPEILKRALAKLQQLHVSSTLNDLRVPPSNRLELLKGNRAGQYSIRINDQWRICFVWQEDNNAAQVEITDYH
jgi:proteic killer suppression protein